MALIRAVVFQVQFDYENQSLEDLCYNTLKELNPKLATGLGRYKTYTDKLITEYYDEYLVCDGLLYHISEIETPEEFSIVIDSFALRTEIIAKYDDIVTSTHDVIRDALQSVN